MPLQIYVEIERARLTKALARLKEAEGNVQEAAEILQEVPVVSACSARQHLYRRALMSPLFPWALRKAVCRRPLRKLLSSCLDLFMGRVVGAWEVAAAVQGWLVYSAEQQV